MMALYFDLSVAFCTRPTKITNTLRLTWTYQEGTRNEISVRVGLLADHRHGNSCSGRRPVRRGTRRRSRAPYYSPVYNWTGFYLGINGGGGWGGPPGRRRRLQRLRRPDRRDHRLQLADQPVRGRRRGRHRLVGHQRHHQQLLSPAARPATPGSPPCAAAPATPSTGCCRISPPASRSATFSANRAGASRAAAITTAGWTVGAGLRIRRVGNVTAKAEYLYVDLGDFNCGLNCGLVPNVERLVLHQRVARRHQRPLLIGGRLRLSTQESERPRQHRGLSFFERRLDARHHSTPSNSRRSCSRMFGSGSEPTYWPF